MKLSNKLVLAGGTGDMGSVVNRQGSGSALTDYASSGNVNYHTTYTGSEGKLMCEPPRGRPTARQCGLSVTPYTSTCLTLHHNYYHCARSLSRPSTNSQTHYTYTLYINKAYVQ